MGKPRVGYTDLLDEPEERRYEIYDGEVFVVPSPGLPHQVALWNLAAVLREYQHACGGLAFCAPLDIVFSEHDVLQPDLVYFAPERAALLAPERWDPVRVPPDLAVEVLSPSTEARDRGRKQHIYAQYRVPEYWIVDVSARTLEIRVLEGDSYRVFQIADEHTIAESPTLRNLRLSVGRIFEIGL